MKHEMCFIKYVLFIVLSDFLVSCYSLKARSQKTTLNNTSTIIKQATAIKNISSLLHDPISALRSKFKVPKKGFKPTTGNNFKVTKLFKRQDKTTTTRNSSTPPDKLTLSPYSIKQIIEKIAINNEKYAAITVEAVVRTVEYNDIVLMKIVQKHMEKDNYFRRGDSSEKYAKDDTEKKIVLIVHGLNVEYIRDVPALYRQEDFQTLLGYYMKHLDKFDIYLMPLANPDGVAKNMENPMWAKNCSPQDACPGVFLDRNFDVAWNQSVEVNSCHPRYPGHTPFSEIESRAVRNVLHQFSHKIVAFLNVNPNLLTSNIKGEAVLFPRGFTEVSNDDDKYFDMKGEVEEALKNITIKHIPIEMTSLHNWYGRISGSSVDYAAQVYGIPYALELLMQSYKADFIEMVYRKYVLKEIWENILDAIFNNIYKSIIEL